MRTAIDRDASPAEVAAIVAALERFRRDVGGPPGATAPPTPADGWSEAALREGVERGAEQPLREPWLTASPGR